MKTVRSLERGIDILEAVGGKLFRIGYVQIAGRDDGIRQCVHRHRDEIHQHDLSHGTQSRHRSGHRRAQESRLADRGVAHPLPAKAYEQPAMQSLNILAQQEDAYVLRHRLPESIINCFRETHPFHETPPSG